MDRIPIYSEINEQKVCVGYVEDKFFVIKSNPVKDRLNKFDPRGIYAIRTDVFPQLKEMGVTHIIHEETTGCILSTTLDQWFAPDIRVSNHGRGDQRLMGTWNMKIHKEAAV
jgi:hypothetical protein